MTQHTIITTMHAAKILRMRYQTVSPSKTHKIVMLESDGSSTCDVGDESLRLSRFGKVEIVKLGASVGDGDGERVGGEDSVRWYEMMRILRMVQLAAECSASEMITSTNEYMV